MIIIIYSPILFEFVSYAVYTVEQLSQALRYKPKGRGFDSLWGQWFFH
jgi:hypothetical protein